MTHTPGPWKFEKIGKPYGIHEKGMAFRILAPETHRAKDYEIAITYYKPLFETAEANARLITAAPDLLKALELAAKELRTTPHTQRDSISCTLLKIEKEIAKAKPK